MWIVAGVLLGSVLLFSLLGLHLGPHSHAVAGVLGVVAAAFLVAMLASGHTESLLFLLLGADLATTTGTGYLAWRGLRDERAGVRHHGTARLEGSVGIVTSDLDPEGVVRVGGESWSATSLDGTIRKGATVHVVSAKGVRLEVLPADSPEVPPSERAALFALEPPVATVVEPTPHGPAPSDPPHPPVGESAPGAPSTGGIERP